jgi:hypothetical protein
MRRVHLRLTRAVAAALQDSAVRASVRSAILASPYPDHQVPFRNFLAGDGAVLVNRIAQLMGESKHTVMSRLDSTVELVLSMPVAAHLQAWTGDTSVIVVGVLQDGLAPVGFDLADRQLSGITDSQAPITPTIVLVYAERKFDPKQGPAMAECLPEECEPPCQGAGCGGGGGNPGNPFLKLKSLEITGDWDPWYAPSPEFEIHVNADPPGAALFYSTVITVSSNTYYVLQAYNCIGELRNTVWDYNGGYVMYVYPPVLLSASAIASDPRFTGTIGIRITENDDGDNCGAYSEQLGSSYLLDRGWPSYDASGLFNPDDLVQSIALNDLHGFTVSNLGQLKFLKIEYAP